MLLSLQYIDKSTQSCQQKYLGFVHNSEDDDDDDTHDDDVDDGDDDDTVMTTVVGIKFERRRRLRLIPTPS